MVVFDPEGVAIGGSRLVRIQSISLRYQAEAPGRISARSSLAETRRTPDTTPTTAETGTPWRSLSSPYEALLLKLTLGCASPALAVLTVRQVAEKRQ